MRIFKTILCLSILINLASCASGYKSINPAQLNYNSVDTKDGVTLKYRYNLLDKKYAKKEKKKDVRLVAVEITNNSGRDLKFGQDISIAYSLGNGVYLMGRDELFKAVKQSPASHLFYLLLTPLNFTTSSSSSNGTTSSSSTPIGLVIGPGLAGGNMIVASGANKKLKTDLMNYDLNNMVIANGKTVHGLLGLRSNSFDALKLVVQ